MQRGDGRLERVPAGVAAPERAEDQLVRLGDRLLVPGRTVLLRQQRGAPVLGRTGGPAGVVGEEERQEPPYLPFVRQEAVQHPGQIERAPGEVVLGDRGARGCGVAGGEEEMDGGEDGVEAVGELGGGGHPEGDAGGDELLLGAGDAGRHGGLGDEERPCDVGGRDAADEAQGEGDLGGGGEGGVAAEEDEPEAVVGSRCGLACGFGFGSAVRPRFRLDQQVQLRPEGLGAAQRVEGVVPGGGRQPGTGPVRYPAARPVDEGGGIRVLDALLGQVEVARDAYRRGEHGGPLATVRVLDGAADRRVTA